MHVSCARRNANVDRAQRPGEEAVGHEAGALNSIQVELLSAESTEVTS